MPALRKVGEDIAFAGIGYARPEEWFDDMSMVPANVVSEQQDRERAKAQTFIDMYGGSLYCGYRQLIESEDVDAVYLPLPPALHCKWAKVALDNGKHVFLEKPSTASLADTESLVKLASAKELALCENYMFLFHNQIRALDEVVRSGEIGDIRLYRISFGFPMRTENDFRYNKALGGGALLDAGGYPLRYADYLLGSSARIVTAQANKIKGFEVEMFGSCTMVNDSGVTAQLAFGMDNDYKCEVEIWGSKGTITSGRIFTAPDGFVPSYTVKKNQVIESRQLPADDAFRKSIERFVLSVKDNKVRNENYGLLQRQEYLVECFKRLSGMGL